MLKAGFVVGCAMLPPAFAQVGWQPRVDVGPDAPAHAAMAYDEARGAVVLFGGLNRVGTGATMSTWEWANGRWVLRYSGSPALPPFGRYGCAMAYDPIRQRVVVFGGFDRGGVPLDDTWLWDGSTWVQQQTPSRPSARGHARLAFHAASGGLVLFGGGSASAALSDETWVLTAAGWTMSNPASRPSARWDFGLASDTVRGRLVLFGGYSPGTRNDTWEWDGVTWQQRTPAVAPPAVAAPAMCYDPVRQRTLLSVADLRADANATWAWDGHAWVESRPALAPSRRAAHAMAYDVQRQRAVLFGDADRDLSTWEWDGTTWAGFDAQIPGRRSEAAIAHHPPSGTSILFGGYSPAQGLAGIARDTWAWNGTAWRLVASTGPSARTQHAMAYDPRTERVVLFGGMDPWNGIFNDTWSWDGTAWSAGPGGPSGRHGHALAAHGSGLVLFGGEYSGVLFGDTWELVLGYWRPIGAGSRPSARRGHAMASAGGRLILFGGFDGTVQGDTWAYTSQGWQLLAPAQSPPPRRDHAMVYDAARARVVLFGGEDGGQRFDDVWEWDGATWERRAVPLIAIPSVRSGHAMVYDSDRRNVVVYGGEGGDALHGAWTDTWTYQTSRPASFSNFGTPCHSSTRIAAATLPWLGDTFVLTVGSIWGAGAVLFGTSRTTYRGQPLPLDLSPLGLTGCALLVSPDAMVMTPHAYQWSILLPRDSSLVGRRLFLQTVVERPGVNPAGLLTSDGAEVVFGLR